MFGDRFIRIEWIIALSTLFTAIFIVKLLIYHLLKVELATLPETFVVMQLCPAIHHGVIRKIISECICNLTVFRLLCSHRFWRWSFCLNLAPRITYKRRLEVFGGLNVWYSLDLIVLEIIILAPIINFFLGFSLNSGYLLVLV